MRIFLSLFLAFLLMFSCAHSLLADKTTEYSIQGKATVGHTNIEIFKMFTIIDGLLEEDMIAQDLIELIVSEGFSLLRVQDEEKTLRLFITEQICIDISKPNVKACSMTFLDSSGRLFFSIPLDVRYTTGHILRKLEGGDILSSLLPPYQTVPVVSKNQLDYSQYVSQHMSLSKQQLLDARDIFPTDEYRLLRMIWFISQIDYLSSYDHLLWMISDNEDFISKYEVRADENYGNMNRVYIYTDLSSDGLRYALIFLLDHEDRVLTAHLAPAVLGEKIVPPEGIAFSQIALALKQADQTSNKQSIENKEILSLFDLLSRVKSHEMAVVSLIDEAISQNETLIWNESRDNVQLHVFDGFWLKMAYPSGKKCEIVYKQEGLMVSLEVELQPHSEIYEQSYIHPNLHDVLPSHVVASRTVQAFVFFMSFASTLNKNITLDNVISILSNDSIQFGNRYKADLTVDHEEKEYVVLESVDYGEGLIFALFLHFNEEEELLSAYLAPVDATSERVDMDLNKVIQVALH